MDTDQELVTVLIKQEPQDSLDATIGSETIVFCVKEEIADGTTPACLPNCKVEGRDVEDLLQFSNRSLTMDFVGLPHFASSAKPKSGTDIASDLLRSSGSSNPSAVPDDNDDDYKYVDPSVFFPNWHSYMAAFHAEQQQGQSVKNENSLREDERLVIVKEETDDDDANPVLPSSVVASPMRAPGSSLGTAKATLPCRRSLRKPKLSTLKPSYSNSAVVRSSYKRKAIRANKNTTQLQTSRRSDRNAVAGCSHEQIGSNQEIDEAVAVVGPAVCVECHDEFVDSRVDLHYEREPLSCPRCCYITHCLAAYASHLSVHLSKKGKEESGYTCLLPSRVGRQ